MGEVDSTTYTIAYTLNGGTNHGDNPGTYTIVTDTITLKDPTRAHYTFAGWYDNAGFGGSAITTIAKARPEPRRSLPSGQQSPMPSPTTSMRGPITQKTRLPIPSRQPTITLQDPTRTGYTFGGWFAAADFSGSATATICQGILRAKTLWAKWTPTTYTIAYTLNGGTNHWGQPWYLHHCDRHHHPQGSYPCALHLAGWYDNAGFGGSAITTIAKGSSGAKTFFAKWTAVPYAITYNLNEGTNNAENPATYTIETPTITLQDPTRTGYTFGGWFAAADFSGSATATIAKGSSGAKTLWAKWTPTTYTIAYTLNGGTNHGDNPGTYTIVTVTITLKDPTRAHYTFAGWYDNVGFGGSAITTIAKGSSGAKTFFAKWTAVPLCHHLQPQ